MLSQLYIKNIAVIREAVIDFENGLNVFTGETGAGKSILINAINAVLGERISKDMIRTGENKAVISAIFLDLPDIVQKDLDETGYACDEEENLLIYREISQDGKSVCKINGRPATISILKQISPLLINIHGQHDNQQLLSQQKHLHFLDSYGALTGMLGQYQELYCQYTAAKSELEEMDIDEEEKNRQIDLLRYQIDEIDAANLEPGEEEALKSERRLLQNAVDVTRSLQTSIGLLEGFDNMQGLSDLLISLSQEMEQAAQYMQTAQPLSERITGLSYEFEGMAGEMRELLDSFDCDPARLEAVEERLDLIYHLKKKYGQDIWAILDYRERSAEELDILERSDSHRQELSVRVKKLQEEAMKAAEQLSEKRKQAALAFTKAVQEELRFLDMPSVTLSVRQEQKPLSEDGIDSVELFLSTNVGEDEKSLAKIASGGELSRIMLSIKNVLASHDDVETMIFDEVDSGVSGRAAQKIGKKLAQVSQNRQVIVVTHLAQVACYANRHLLIAKHVEDGRTFTTISPLSDEERIRELARINAGEEITGLAVEHAREMLENAKKG